MMINSRDDVAARRQIITEPHQLHCRSSGSVGQEDERILLFRVGDFRTPRNCDWCEELSIGRPAKDSFAFASTSLSWIPDGSAQRPRADTLPIHAVLIGIVARDHSHS